MKQCTLLWPCALALVCGCSDCDFGLIAQQHVFDAPLPSACRTVDVSTTVSLARAADILFVMDNSRSMAEEQDNLRRNASSLGNGGACGTAASVLQLRDYMHTGEGRGLDVEDWNRLPNGPVHKAIYEDCGFIERLQLYGNDFQIGVITTDMRDQDGFNGTCPSGAFPNGRGALPARGCLVPVPGGGRLVRATDGDIATISGRFQALVNNVGTCGSGVEEGLRAMEAFLSADTVRADPSCNADLTSFLRSAPCQRGDGGACLVDAQGNSVLGPQPKLVVVFLSDEEDCSTTNSPDGGPQTLGVLSPLPARCYSQPEFLFPPVRYSDFVAGVRSPGNAPAVATIVGGTRLADGSFVAGDCRCNPAAVNAPPVTTCHTVQGSSNDDALCGVAVADPLCGPLPPATFIPPGASAPCCTADRGDRYVQFAQAVPTHIMDSICSQSYKATLLEVADVANAPGEVALGERVQDPRQMVVEVRASPDDEYTRIAPWSGTLDDARFLACEGCPQDAAGACNSGYALKDNCASLQLLGSDVPAQGAEIRVRFLGQAAPGGPRCR